MSLALCGVFAQNAFCIAFGRSLSLAFFMLLFLTANAVECLMFITLGGYDCPEKLCHDGFLLLRGMDTFQETRDMNGHVLLADGVGLMFMVMTAVVGMSFCISGVRKRWHSEQTSNCCRRCAFVLQGVHFSFVALERAQTNGVR